MRTADFYYELPPELIAQRPTPQRDASRLLVVHRTGDRLEHRRFPDLLDYLQPGDLLVMNNSRVIPARLHGFKVETGGAIEVLLVEEAGPLDWWVMLRPGKRVRAGTQIKFTDAAGAPAKLAAVVQEKNAEGHCRLTFSGTDNLLETLAIIGETPLPPYIARAPHTHDPEDTNRYQTVYAQAPGSVAAPTAGLHFTPELLATARARGIGTAFVTLHVGLGTFAPVKASDIAAHTMHEERYDLPAETLERILATRAAGRRVVAVGTTTVRVLESVARQPDGLRPGPGRTRIFIHPPADFHLVDALITNFHLPESTLLMLVSAFATPNALHGRERMLAAYAEAVRERYRFFSYGDAMLIL